MAYIVNKTDGTAITTIVDGTIDNTTTLTLFGRGYSGFGELLNEDLVKLLENSASTSAPSAPLKGELWFDTSTNQIKVYDGDSFKPTGGAKAQASSPTGSSAGDLWVDTNNNQLYFYSGGSFRLAGPVYTSGQTLSGWDIETVNDSFGVSKVIASMYVANTRVAVLSKETFTPAPAMTGFAEIKAGLTLSTSVGGATFGGTTTATNFVDVSGTTNDAGDANKIAGGNFLRSDVADTSAGRITVSTDDGVVIGDGSDLQLSVTGVNAFIKNVTSDGDLNFNIRPGGSDTQAIHIDGQNSRVGIFNASPQQPLDITGNVRITGNLEVSGEYSNTTSNINVIDDAFIKVNSGGSEVDAGLIVETSDTDDARLFYDVSGNHFSAGQGGTYSQIIRLADAVNDGDADKGKVLKTDSLGNVKATTMTLGQVGSNISTTDTSNQNTPSIGQLAESITRWGGSYQTDDGANSTAGKRYVETAAPNPGVNDIGSAAGDLWFVREA